MLMKTQFDGHKTVFLYQQGDCKRAIRCNLGMMCSVEGGGEQVSGLKNKLPTADEQ